MIKTFVTALILLIAPVVFAETNQRMRMGLVSTCSSISTLHNELTQQHGEIGFLESEAVFFRKDGVMSAGQLRVYANPQSNTMTLTIEFEEDDVACIVFMGDNLRPIIPGEEL